MKENEIKTFYEGEIHKCPFCDTILDSFVSKCSSCGREIRGIKLSKSIERFSELYNKCKNENEKINLITSFIVPNTREDLIEFLFLAKTNILREDLDGDGILERDEIRISNAWKIKLDQCFEKAKMLLSKEDIKMFYDTYQDIENQKQKKINNEKKEIKKIKIQKISRSLLKILLLVGIGVGGYFGYVAIDNIDKAEYMYNVLDDGTAEIRAGKLLAGKKEITIPSIIDGYIVSKIADNGFNNNRYMKDVKKINFDAGSQIKTIGKEAFKDNDYIENIFLPKSLIEIKKSAFLSCTNLKYVLITDSIISIEESAFSECESLYIYCNYEYKPREWSDGWIDDVNKVSWGIKNFYEGEGTALSPFKITNAIEFDELRRYKNSNLCFKLQNDIDLSEIVEWEPIEEFYGVFDGNNHYIKNINYCYTGVPNTSSTSEEVSKGLFCDNYGTIKNLKIENANYVIAPDWTNQSRSIFSGILVGHNYKDSEIINCSVSNAEIRVDSSNVGLLFEEKNQITPSQLKMADSSWVNWIRQTFDHNIDVADNWWKINYYHLFVGGVCGYNEGTIDKCNFQGSIVSNLYHMEIIDSILQEQYTGGVVGLNTGSVQASYSESNIMNWIEMNNNGEGLGWVGDIYPKANSFIGGIIGYNKGTQSKNHTSENNVFFIDYRIYAPQYLLFSGADYHSSTKGHPNNLKRIIENICVEVI